MRADRPPRVRFYRRPDSPAWSVEIRWRGRCQLRQSTGCDRKGDAERWAAEAVARITGDPGAQADAEGSPYTIEEAVSDFLAHGLSDVADGSKHMYRIKAGHVARVLGTMDIAAVDSAAVAKYINTRRTEDGAAKDHTIAKELVAFRRTLAFAQERKRVKPGWRVFFPEKFRTGYDPRDRWLTPEEYLRLLDAVEPERELWIVSGCYLGGRLSELERIDCRRDVDLANGFVTLRTAKVRKGQPRKPRHIPIAPELRKALLAAGADTRIGPLFPEPWANPALMLTRAARKAKICGPTETINDNDLRRTFASWMLQKGATVAEVAKLLGHGSTAMVERVYGHLAAQNLISAVGRLPEFERERGTK